VNLDVAGLAFADSAVEVIVGPLVGVVGDTLSLELDFVEADLGNLRVGVGAVGEDNLGEIHLSKEQGVPHYVPSVGVRVVSKLEAWQAITDGVDVFVGGGKVVVHFDARPLPLDTSCFKIHILDIRSSAHSEEDSVEVSLLRFTILRIFDYHLVVLSDLGSLRHLDHFALEKDFNSILHHLVLQEFDNVSIVAREELAAFLQHGHFGTEPGKALAELTSDGAGPDDEEGLRLRGHVEDVVGGPVHHVTEALDRRDEGASTGSDASLRELEGLAIHFNFILALELGMTKENVNTIAVSKALGCVIWRYLGSNLPDPLHDSWEIHFNLALDADTKLFGRLNLVSYRS